MLRSVLSLSVAQAAMSGSGCVSFNAPVGGNGAGTNSSTSSSSTTTADSTAPIVSAMSSSAGTTVVASNISAFPIAGSCTNGDGNVSLTVGAITVGSSACGGGTFSANANLSSISDGAVTLTASQTDAAGNTGSTTLAITIDNTICSAGATAVTSGNLSAGFPTGSSEAGVIYLCSATQLAQVSSILAANGGSATVFRLRNHIDGGGAAWTPITNMSTGDEFDGNGFTISNYEITTAAQTGNGFFASLGGGNAGSNGANVHHLTFNDVNLSGTSQGCSGIVAGFMTDRSILNQISVTASTLSVTGNSGTHACLTFPSRYGVGGIVGAVQGRAGATGWVATLSNITATNLNVTATAQNYVGGIAGLIQENASLSSITSTGHVSGNNYVGGIVGQWENRDIASGVATGTGLVKTSGTITLNGTDDAGGVAGFISGPNFNISASGAGSGVSVTSSAGSFLGGFAGVITSNSLAGTSTISQSYSRASVTGGASSYSLGGFAGRAFMNSAVASHWVIQTSFSSGTVTAGGTNTAGFIGDIGGNANASKTYIIRDCFSTSSVVSTAGNIGNNVGGFIAQNGADENGATDLTLLIERSFYAGTVTNSDPDPSKAAFILVQMNGVNDATTLTNTYYNTSTWGVGLNDGAVALVAGALNAAQFTDLDNFTGYMASGNWKFDPAISTTHPVLSWQ